MINDGIIYPVVDKDEWSNRYSLSIKSGSCTNCGKTLTADIPFATGNWRGLTSKPHDCGKEYDLFVATKSNDLERKKLVDTFNALSFQLTYCPQ